jgi:hypothetical protein
MLLFIEFMDQQRVDLIYIKKYSVNWMWKTTEVWGRFVRNSTQNQFKNSKQTLFK